MSETTADTITNAQIKALRTEACRANDEFQVAICDLALVGDIDADLDPTICSRLSDAGWDPCADGVMAKARAECARVIADAEARS